MVSSLVPVKRLSSAAMSWRVIEGSSRMLESRDLTASSPALGACQAAEWVCLYKRMQALRTCKRWEGGGLKSW